MRMKPVLSLLQFTSVLPLGKTLDFDLFARHSWIFPVAGYIIALLVAVPVFFITDTTLAAAVAVAGVILLSGAHHFDGLLDLGDGLMAQGDREKRKRALTDRYVGPGGIAAGVVVTLLLFRPSCCHITDSSPDHRRGRRKIFYGLSYCIRDTLQRGNAQLPSPVCKALFPLPLASIVHPACSSPGIHRSTSLSPPLSSSCARWGSSSFQNDCLGGQWRCCRGGKRDHPGACYCCSGTCLIPLFHREAQVLKKNRSKALLYRLNG